MKTNVRKCLWDIEKVKREIVCLHNGFQDGQSVTKFVENAPTHKRVNKNKKVRNKKNKERLTGAHTSSPSRKSVYKALVCQKDQL